MNTNALNLEFQPNFRARHYTPERTFVTKWDVEINNNRMKKIARRRERDTKYFVPIHENDNDCENNDFNDLNDCDYKDYNDKEYINEIVDVWNTFLDTPYYKINTNRKRAIDGEEGTRKRSRV
jgi:hypothetical protein